MFMAVRFLPVAFLSMAFLWYGGWCPFGWLVIRVCVCDGGGGGCDDMTGMWCVCVGGELMRTVGVGAAGVAVMYTGGGGAHKGGGALKLLLCGICCGVVVELSLWACCGAVAELLLWRGRTCHPAY